MPRNLTVNTAALHESITQRRQLQDFYTAKAALVAAQAKFIADMNAHREAELPDDALARRVAELDRATWMHRTASIAHAARLAGVLKTTVRWWIGREIVRAVKIERDWLVCVDDVLNTAAAALDEMRDDAAETPEQDRD
jgi:hypothetical protein